jgi:hypothetical protein
VSGSAGSLFHIQAIKWQGAVPGAMSKREFNNEILKPSYQDLGEWFHQNRLPLRFTNQAKSLLNLAPRKGEQPGLPYKMFKRSYTGRKQRYKGHRKPFVWSGETERDATRIRDVRATSGGVKIVLHARKLNYRHPKSAIRMNEEIRRIAESEYPLLQQQLNKAVQSRINADTRSRPLTGT